MDALIYIFPLLLANLVHHVVVIPYGLLPWLARPLDNGMMVGGRRLFGSKKTDRGFIVVVVLTALFAYLMSFFVGTMLPLQAAYVGFALGFAYMLGELPTSFLKRKFDIPESGTGRGRIGRFFAIYDHVDSILFALIALLILKDPLPFDIAVLFALGVFLHFAADNALRTRGYKRHQAGNR